MNVSTRGRAARSALLVGVLLGCSSLPALSAGMTTHALMADFGRRALPESALKGILTRHRPTLLAGAIHPDGGYGSGVGYPADREMAERAHWADFTLAYIRYLRERTNCASEARSASVEPPKVEDPVGAINLIGISDRCARLISFMMGNASHGLTDQTWDSLFEPVVRERGEDPNPIEVLGLRRLFGPFTPGPTLKLAIGADNYQSLSDVFGATPLNAIEYAMDMVAIYEQSLWAEAPTLELPPVNDLIEVFRLNRPAQGVNGQMITRAHFVARSAVQAERIGAPIEIARIRNQMPWAASNYYTSGGGVVDSGYMVSGYYRQLWQQLTAADTSSLPPEVIGVHPRHGERDVPVGRNAAGLRVHAFIGHAVSPASVRAAGAFRLLDEQGQEVAGQVIPGIYQQDFTHTMKLFPAADLQPDHRYTAVLSTQIADERGQPLAREFRWSFTTAAD